MAKRGLSARAPGEVFGGPPVTKKRKEVVDRFTRLESRHFVKHCGTDWKQQARKSTALPITTTDGQVVIQPRDVQDAELPEAGEEMTYAFKPQSKPEAQEKTSLGYRKCAEYLTVAQREALTEQDLEFNQLSLLDFLLKVEELAHICMQDPQTELYKLESVFSRMERYRVLFERCKSLTEMQDLCKSYLVLFVALGRLFKHLLPGYVVVDSKSDGADAGPRKLAKKASRSYELLALHLYSKWLIENLQNFICHNSYILADTELLDPICELLGDAVHSLKSFNLRDEFLTVYLSLLARTSNDVLFSNLALALEQDLQLSLAAILVPKILKRAYNLKKSEEGKPMRRGPPRRKNTEQDAGSECFEPGILIGKTMRLCDHLLIDKKEKNAIAEMQRKGITEKQVLAKRSTQVQARLQKDLAMGLVSGDFKKFQENKKLILETIMKLFISVVRNPTNYSVECVYESLRSLSKHADLINLEMVHEIFDELKNLAASVPKSKKYSDTAASLVLAAVMAAIELMKMSSRSSDMYIESDVLWIVPAVIDAAAMLVFSVSQTPSLAVLGSGADGVGIESLDTRNRLCLDDLIEILEQVIDSRRSLGSLGESFSHLAKCPKASELYAALSAMTVLCTSQTTVHKLNRLRDILLRRYPTLEGVNDDEGLILDSLSPPLTIAWLKHLAKTSIFASNS